MVPHHAEDEVDLRHYLRVLGRRKWLILMLTVLGAGVAVALSMAQTPMYRAQAQLLLQGQDSELRFGAVSGDGGAQRIATELGVMTSDLVRDAVREELGRQPSVSVSAVGQTDIVAISATSTAPQQAANEANVYAEVYIDWRRERTIEELLAAQQTIQQEVDSIQDRIAALEQPIEELERAAFFEEDALEEAAIRERISDLEARTEAERESLLSTLALYQSDLSSLQVSQRINRTGGVQMISQASPPQEPFSPQPIRNGVLGGVVGLVLGVGLAFLREAFDDRVRSREELERITGWPTIGLIPIIAGAKGGEHDLATLEAPKSPAAEAYRTLRTAVQFLGLERPLNVIQVTSAKPGEGKTTTASNLAITLAQAGKRVILLDADLRKPRLHHEFGVPNRIGFTSMLLDTNLSADAFHRTSVKNLVVVPSGPPPPNPSELLSLAATRRVIDLLRGECDVLVIDSPPVLPVTDPLVIAGYVDGVILVVDSKTVQGKALNRTRELLDQVQAKVIGVSVNQTDDSGGYGYGYGYGYGGEYAADVPVEEQEAVEDSPERRPRIFSR